MTEVFDDSKKLLNFLDKPKLSDCILTHKSGLKYNIHKIILYSSSKYIAETIDNEPLDKIEDKESLLIPPIINSENEQDKLDTLIRILLKYAYSNQEFKDIENLLNENNVYQLLRYATCFKMEKLSNDLSCYISEKGFLNIENCARILKEALMLENKELIDECLKLINQHMGIILKNENEKNALLDLPYTIFKQIMSSDTMIIESEKLILDCILDYIKMRRILKLDEKEHVSSGDHKLNEVIDVDKDQKELNPEEKDKKELNIEEPKPDEEKENLEVVKEQKKSIYNKYEEKCNLLSKLFTKVKLSNEEERNLYLCIRFSFLSHKELIGLNNILELNDHKDLILEGISIRLNPYETIEQNQYKINILPRQYINLSNNQANIKQEQIETKHNIKQDTQGSKFNQYNPVKSYDDINKLTKPIQLNSGINENTLGDYKGFTGLSNAINIPINYNSFQVDSQGFNSNIKNIYNKNTLSSSYPLNNYDYVPQKNYIDSINFSYDHDFDENGIIYYLGTEGGRKSFKNPHEMGIIRVFSSSIGKGKVSDLVNRELVNLRTLNEPQSFFGIDLGEDRQLIPSCYSIMNRASTSHVMLCWQLEASNDRINYEILDTRIFLTNDLQMNHELEKERNMLKEPGCTSTWGIDPGYKEKFPKGFRYFILKQIGKNSSGSFNMAISGFEIYGKSLGKGWFFN